MLHDFSQSEAVIRGEFLAMLSAWQSPSVLYRAKIFPFPDGDAWCCLYGENIQDGVCAFGATPAEAARNFDWYVWHGKPVPEANLDAEREKVKTDKEMYFSTIVDLRTELSQLQALVREIKDEFDNCTHECERCGESDPLTTFDIYPTVVRAATLDGTTPAHEQVKHEK